MESEATMRYKKHSHECLMCNAYPYMETFIFNMLQHVVRTRVWETARGMAEIVADYPVK